MGYEKTIFLNQHTTRDLALIPLVSNRTACEFNKALSVVGRSVNSCTRIVLWRVSDQNNNKHYRVYVLTNAKTQQALKHL